jgi:hypothetical protein
MYGAFKYQVPTIVAILNVMYVTDTKFNTNGAKTLNYSTGTPVLPRSSTHLLCSDIDC